MLTNCEYVLDFLKLEELLQFRALTENCSITSFEAPGSAVLVSLPVPVCQMAQEPDPLQACDSSLSDMVIIVNTQNFDKEMIISRRSTYQQILSIEKRGVQVLERDLIFPVDIILDATSCIVWYDWQNMGRKATAEDEGSSCIPLCIENIATNILASLSFTFTTCILVFEGEINFLGAVMEYADEFYAAAASLGTDLQIFCSYSRELTDEIILNFIGQARKFPKGLFSRLPETETHAESFLTKFPSINPLSAHAIISCGCMLLEFLELSADSRIHTLRKYKLPDESVNLLNFLFKYGEREESKSGVTDCSSSVSSPLDSEKFVGRIRSGDRKIKFIPSSSDAVHENRRITPSEKCINDGMLWPSDSKVSKSPRFSLQKNLPDFLLDGEIFREGDGSGSATNMDPSKGFFETNDCGTLKIPKLANECAKSSLKVSAKFDQRNLRGSNKNAQEECAEDILHDRHQDFVGEVVDMFDNSSFDVDFRDAKRAGKSSIMDFETANDYDPGCSRAARRLSFGGSSCLNFAVDDELNPRHGLAHSRQLMADTDYDNMDYNWGSYSFNPQQELMGTRENSPQNFSSPLSREEEVPPCGETPLSKAVHSAQQQRGSPWTIEFMNRIKEKRRLRQQNQPVGASGPHSGSQGNFTKVTKRRSPSILEYYKYQGGSHGSTPRKSDAVEITKATWSHEQ